MQYSGRLKFQPGRKSVDLSRLMKGQALPIVTGEDERKKLPSRHHASVTISEDEEDDIQLLSPARISLAANNPADRRLSRVQEFISMIPPPPPEAATDSLPSTIEEDDDNDEKEEVLPEVSFLFVYVVK